MWAGRRFGDTGIPNSRTMQVVSERCACQPLAYSARGSCETGDDTRKGFTKVGGYTTVTRYRRLLKASDAVWCGAVAVSIPTNLLTWAYFEFLCHIDGLNQDAHHALGNSNTCELIAYAKRQNGFVTRTRRWLVDTGLGATL